jgi:NADH-quinone oxidoreductase subunit H
MGWAELAVFAAKAVFVVMFGMNVAVILTWADRRQGAIIQDRVGPNRAVAWLPTPVAQGLLIAPALLVAFGIGYLAYAQKDAPGQPGMAMLFGQLGILGLWLTAVMIAGRVRVRGVKNSFDAFVASIGDPRRIVLVGMAAHALLLLAGLMMRGRESALFADYVYGPGAAILLFAIVGGALYSALALQGQPRVGLRLAGLLHPAADGLKTLWKEDIIPPGADRFLHSIAPIISFFPALVVLAVVPFGDALCFGTQQGKLDLGALLQVVPRDGLCADGAVPLQVLDVNVGILFFFALAGTGVIGAALAGWSSNNKFSLLGGLRAASQMVSYEVTLGLTVIGALMIYGTLRIDDMVRWQAEHAWGIFVQPFAFVLFLAASIAESKRIPFDLPEGESEIVAGYFTEYSGMKFAMFFFSEYVAVVSSSALIAALFLGGWHVPFLDRGGIRIAFGDTVLISQQLTHLSVILIGVGAFILKTLTLCWLQLTIRWTLPRFRYDQLMKLGWRKLLPASLVNILITGLVVLALQQPSAGLARALGIAGDVTEAIVFVIGAGLFVWFVLFALEPANKRRILVASSQRFAAAMGGTRTARMGA